MSAPAYKVFHLLVPRDGLDADGFATEWDAYAAALVPDLDQAEGFQYYVRTPRSAGDTGLGAFHGDYAYDGVEVLSFASAAAALAVKPLIRERSAGFLDPSSTLLVTREHVFVNGAPIGPDDTGPGVKAVTSLRRVPGMSLEDFRYRWLHSHGPYVVETQGVARYIQNHVVTDEYLDGEPRYDGFVEAWHRLTRDQATTFADPMMTDVQANDIPQFIDTATFFSIQCVDAEHWVTGSRPHLSIGAQS